MYLNKLPANHQELLSRYKEHLTNIRKCIDENHKIIRKIIQDVNVFKMFANNLNNVTNNENDLNNTHVKVRAIDLDKVSLRI